LVGKIGVHVLEVKDRGRKRLS